MRACKRLSFEVHDPSTGAVIGKCAEFNTDDAMEAIAAATEAFASFRKTLPRERAKMLRKWYDLMVAKAEDLATLITWENGKPLSDAKGEVAFASNFFEWFNEEAARTYGDTIPASNLGNRVMTLKQPVGVCAMITPWNFPAAMLTRKVGAALAAGCTVVVKPAGETPFTANTLAELSRRAGVPPGVVNLVPGLKNTVAIGQLLTTDSRIKKVSFTGSTNVGKLLMQQSSPSLKKLSLELGGNAPFIVFDDCPDIEGAVLQAVNCKFRSSGQTCICANRIYVHRNIYDTFAQKLTERVNQFKVGHGFDNGVTHGPLIHDRAVNKAEEHFRDAQEKGARVTIGGKRLPDLGPNFYAPTVLTGVNSQMLITSEESFGPVALLIPFSSEKDVVAMANSVSAGMIGVNTGPISDVVNPFGGVKESGFGSEGSKYGVDEYTTIKSITVGGIQDDLQG
ncbi:putative succinate-semialdehyde dehydrogenase [Thozetella sp. PMI_491]|nr:putative succinate-semialdehyde dehydrogenase [Thozetella sp. PMI_491]